MEVELARPRSEPQRPATVHMGRFRSAGRHGEGLMRYPLLVQTRIGNPDRLVAPEKHQGHVLVRRAWPLHVRSRVSDGLPN